MKSSTQAASALLVALTLALAGCGSSGEAEVAAWKAKQRKDLEEKLALAQNALKSGPSAFPKQEPLLRAIVIDSEERFPELAQTAKSALKDGRKAWKDQGATALADMEKTVKAALSKASGASDTETAEAALEEARKALRSFPEEYYAVHGERHEELRREVAAAAGIGARANEVIEKAERMRKFHFYENALGILESFLLVERFKTSPSADRVKSLMETVRKEADEYKEQKAKEEKIPWQVIYKPGMDLLSFSTNPAECFENSRRGFTIDNRTKKDATAITGDPAWTDIAIELEFKTFRYGFDFGVRLSRDRSAFDKLSFSESDYPRLVMHHVRIELRGKTARIISFNDFTVKEVPLTRDAGRIGILISPKSKVQFRSIKMRKLDGGSAGE